MGTSAMTHVVHNGKKIALYDSHDGYFSWMGKQNLFGVKYSTDEQLIELVKAYDAPEEGQVTNRDLQNGLYVMLESNQDASAVEWAKETFADGEIRASTGGFLPFLIMNINPSWDPDYEPTYLIDVDNRQFVYNEDPLFTFSFDKIRNTHPLNLRYFGDKLTGNFSLLSEDDNTGKLINDYLEENDEGKRKELISIIEQRFDTVLSLPIETIENYYNELEKQNQQYREDCEYIDEEVDDGCSYSRSIFNNNDMSPATLRFVVAYMQKLVEQEPTTAFLLESGDWGLNEDGQSAGMRFFSPTDNKNSKKFDEFMMVLQFQLGIRFNIMTSAYAGSVNLSEEAQLEMFGPKGPEKCFFKLNELQSQEGWADAINQLTPMMGYYADYNEVRDFVINNKDKMTNMVSYFWTFNSLVYQDAQILEISAPFMQSAFAEQNEKEKKRIAKIVLESLVDGEKIRDLVSDKSDNSLFMQQLKQCGLVNTIEPYMSKNEKEKYIGKVKKVKP